MRAAETGEIPRGFKLGHLRRWSRAAIVADIASKQQAAAAGGDAS
jgi:predicted DNA-binding transcriptional regulator AlpA